MRFLHVRRGGSYSRVCDPSWATTSEDTTFSKIYGGRWNPSGAFGALYLNATTGVAAANARRVDRRKRYTLFDLRVEERPMLQMFHVTPTLFVNALTAAGIANLHLPKTYPACERSICQAVASAAHVRGERGIAALSAADARFRRKPGEELAIFETHRNLAVKRGGPIPFEQWYPR